MAGIDLTNPQLQGHIFNAVRAAHSNNTKIKSEREKERLRAEERQRHQELIHEMRRANDMHAAPAPSLAPVAMADKPYSNYAPDMDVSIGCVPCTRAHLATIAASLKEAEGGHPDLVAAAREEIVALRLYDLTPEKLASTPERERVVLAKYEAQLGELQAQLSGPAPEATVASASLKEALRFAREDGIQHPEVQIRMEETEEAINSLERVALSPERIAKLSTDQAKQARSALPDIRRVRQDLINHVKTAEDLEAVTARIAVIDQTLNPPPDAEAIKRISKQAQALNKEFRADVLTAWQNRKKEG